MWRISWFFACKETLKVLQIDTNILGVCGQACLNFPKWQICYFFAISHERNEWWSWFFACRQTSKLILTFWTSKFCARWYYHCWRAWSSILKLLKVLSLQYIYNISKKNLGMEVIFCMQININVSTSWYYHFWWKWPDMFKVVKMGSW